MQKDFFISVLTLGLILYYIYYQWFVSRWSGRESIV